MSAFLLRLAWRQSLLRLLVVFLLGALAGWALKAFWPAIAITALALLVWHYWRLHRLLLRMDQRQRFSAMNGQGLWDGLENLLHRRQSESRSRITRLARLLRAYRQAASAMHDGALIIQRASSRIIWFNKASRHLLGLHYPKSLDSNLLDILQSPVARDWLLAGRSDEPLMDLPCPGDENIRLSLRLLPYSNEQWLVVVRDVTQLMRLEQVRRDFVANVSHELRTPLTVVHGYLDMMEPEPDSEWSPMVDEMRRQSQRMTQLVEDLLTLSRLEAQQHLPEETIAMTPMLITLRREAEALSQGRHQIVVEDSAQCDLFGSGKELHSAFSNLVSNAVRYTPSDGRIVIRFARSEDGGAKLAVQDSGYGIPAHHLPRITERFYRVSTSRSRESGGTGLGLSIVKHVLNLHQGRFEIDSEVGRGSTFSCAFGPERVRPRSPSL
jgi:two-component system phosphate regulon sensor histidine kinase PhoR